MLKKGKFWFRALLERLLHILERNYAQKNAHLRKQKFLSLLLLIKNYIQVPWTYQKASLLFSKDPLWNKIFGEKSAQIRRIKHASNVLRSIRSWNCNLSIWNFVGNLRKSYLSLWDKILIIEFGAVSEEFFQL